jgi:hypothetical protein
MEIGLLDIPFPDAVGRIYGYYDCDLWLFKELFSLWVLS